MRIEMADLTRLYLKWQKEHNEAINRVVESGRYIGGDEVDLFAKELSEYLGYTENIVSPCANGSDALLIAYKTIGLKAGDEVIMPAFNYIASLESAARLSITSVLADTDSRKEYRFSINADEKYLDSLLTDRTKAMVMVNMYGMPCDALSLRKYCDKRNIILIEDNAQGIGGYCCLYGHKTPLSLVGDIAITSFFPTKPLGCMGDGGAVITRNKEWLYKARLISQHGQEHKYDYKDIGLNSRLDTLQAAILRLRLSKLDELLQEYNRIAMYYTNKLQGLPIELPCIPHNSYATFYQYTIMLNDNIDRDSVRLYMLNRGVASQLYYPDTLDKIDTYKSCCHTIYPTINAHKVNSTMLSLPIFPFMRTDELDYVVDTLKEALSNYRL